MDKGDRVVIATIHPGELSSMYHESLMALMTYESARKEGSRIVDVVQQICGTGSIPEERNRVTQRFFEHPDQPEWLLWIDADMGFSDTLIEDLLGVADPQDKAIIGALAFGWNRLGTGSLHEPSGWLSPTLYDWDEKIAGFLRRRDYPENTLIQVDATGAACILIHRSALHTIQQRSADAATGLNKWLPENPEQANFTRSGHPKGYDWWTPVPCHSTRLPNPFFGEDMSFCLRAREADIPIHVHTGIETAHDDNRRPLTAGVYRKEQLSYPNIVILAITGSNPQKLIDLLTDLESQDEIHAVIIADNGAPVPLLMMLQQILSSHWLSIFDQRDASPVGAWNACLETVWQQYGPFCNIALLSENISIGPRFISALAQGLRRHQDIAAVGPTDDSERQQAFGIKRIEDGEMQSGQIRNLINSALMIRGQMASTYRFAEEDTEAGLQKELSGREQCAAVTFDTHFSQSDD